MTTKSIAPSSFIGCDVGKTDIVVFDSRTNQTRSIPNRKADLARFARTLDQACFVICEATGGYEAALLRALVQADRAVHRADARKVKAFIRSFGTLGKTDAIDARALAFYGRERHAQLAKWQAPDPARESLQALVLTRRDLVADRLAYRNRLAAPGAAAVKHQLGKLLTSFDQQIAAINRAITALIRAHKTLAAAEKTIRGVIGIGETTAAALLALVPELGTLNRREVASLAGLAPHPNQSGANDAYRRTRGGRPEVKRVLFMAAMVAAKNNPQQRLFYQRLLAQGKKPLVALTAVMRKLVVICNAMLRASGVSGAHSPPNCCIAFSLGRFVVTRRFDRRWSGLFSRPRV
jgi:transposase